MALLMEPGQTYKSWDEFKEALDTHCKTNKVVFNVANAKTVEQANAFMKRPPLFEKRLKYSHCVLHCKHYGSYQSNSSGLRPRQRSYKIDCRAFISVSGCRKKDYLIIRDSYHKHSHPCTDEIYNSYPEVRRMTKEERRVAGMLLDAGIPVAQVKSALGKDVTPKDLHNAKVHIRAVKMGMKSEMPKGRPAVKRNAHILKRELEKSTCSEPETGTGTDKNKDTTSILTADGEAQEAETENNISDSDRNVSDSDRNVLDSDKVAAAKVLSGEMIESSDNISNEEKSQNSGDGEKTSYTVVVSSTQAGEGLNNLQELLEKCQSGEGLPKQARRNLAKDKTHVLDQVTTSCEKSCAVCEKYMSPLDGHSLCLVCLGQDHFHETDCKHCEEMGPEQLKIRQKLLVRHRMKALKEKMEVQHKSIDPEEDLMTYQPRKSNRVRKPKDFGPDISVQPFTSRITSPVKMTKCVVSDGDKEYVVEIPRRRQEEKNYSSYPTDLEPSSSSELLEESQNTDRFNHLLKQTAVFDDVSLKTNDAGVESYEPDSSAVLEMDIALARPNISGTPKGVRGKYKLENQFEAAYCSSPSVPDLSGDSVLMDMSSGLHKLAENASVQTRLAVYDKLFTRLGVGMADEALTILSQLYGKVINVTEISQDDLTNDLQTALDTIQALKDVLEELGIMSKDALSTAAHQRSISVHSLDRAKKAMKRPRPYDTPSTWGKRVKFEPFTKRLSLNQLDAAEAQSVSHSITQQIFPQVKLEVDEQTSDTNTQPPEELNHHIVMEVTSNSDMSQSVVTVPQMALSSELLERLQNQKDGVLELNLVNEGGIFHSASSTAGALEESEAHNVVIQGQTDSAQEVVKSEQAG